MRTDDRENLGQDSAPPDVSGAPGEGRLVGSGSRLGSSDADEPTRVHAPVPSDYHPEAPRIEGYDIHAEVHRGGQGIVYRATQARTKRSVALKVLLEGPYASDVARRRFEREIELAASLRHPHIVTILDSGVSQGRYFFAMDFIEGERLDAFLRRAHPPARATLELLEQICDAVNFAHQRGVIHRDLKPSNILIDANGRPQVLDFGLAKSLNESNPDETTVQVLSHTGAVVGTVAYMSPEQAMGRDVDVRSDVYSLGVIFYEALVGRPPYSLDGPLGEVLNRIAKEDATRPRSVRVSRVSSPPVDDELETILLKALEKEPPRRYQTAGDLGRDLRHYLAGEPIEAKRASGLYMFRKTLRRYRAQAAAASALLLMLIVFLIVFAALYRREAFARGEAEQQRIMAREQADKAAEAGARERRAREDAQANEQRAVRAADELRQALVLQKIQRGELAQMRGDLAAARDSFWDAYQQAPGALQAIWALRRYYLESGDRGSRLLSYAGAARIALSPSGKLAAVQERERGLLLRDVEGEKTIASFVTPTDVTALSIDDAGVVSAAGPGWARAYVAGSHVPLVLADVGEGAAPTFISTSTVRGVMVVVDRGQVLTFRVQDSQPIARARLSVAPVALPAISDDGALLVVPSSAGAELFRIADDGQMSWERIWTPSGGARLRAVSFSGSDDLALLADALYRGRVGAGLGDNWQRIRVPADEWEKLDYLAGSGIFVLAARDGRVALYRDDTLIQDWRVTLGRVESIALSGDGSQVVTLDDQGSLTTWAPRAKELYSQRVSSTPAEKLAVARDGSVALWVERSGRVFASAGGIGEAFPIDSPSVFSLLGGRAAKDVRIAVSGNGALAAFSHTDRIWLRELPRGRPLALRWNNPISPTIRDLALSDDGRLLAVASEGAAGESQSVTFYQVERSAGGGRFVAPRVGEPIEFTGAALRAMAFAPGANELILTRSNGDVLRLATDRSPAASSPKTPWITLESPAQSLALDRAGVLIAAACEDRVVRVISLADGAVIRTVTANQPLVSIGFSPDGRVLLFRDSAGELQLFDLGQNARIASWSEPLSDGQPIAALLGGVGNERLLLAAADGLFSADPAAIDAVVSRNAVYARERSIRRKLATGAFDGAWQDAGPGAGQLALPDAQRAIVEHVLRRDWRKVAPAWLNEVVAKAEAADLARLAHAAYDGGAYEKALSLFTATMERSPGGALDIYSEWRRAELTYLLDRPADAAPLFNALLTRPDFAARDAPRAKLEHIAALVFADRRGEARGRLQQLEGEYRGGAGIDPVALTAAFSVASQLVRGDVSTAPEEQAGAFLRLFREAWLSYRDDGEFFAGELLRLRGDDAGAAQRYQRCIDLARDPWPANWARYRLEKWASRSAAPPAERAQ